MSLDDDVCLCFHVSRRKVLNFVRQTRPRRPSQITDCFGAGSGCGWCIPFLLKLHRQGLGQEVLEEPPSAEEYEAMRAAYRQDVAEGRRARNRHDAPGVAPRAGAGPPGAATSGEAGVEDAAGTGSTAGAAAGAAAAPEPYDFTRYFSRARPDPEPETFGEGDREAAGEGEDGEDLESREDLDDGEE